MLTNGTERVDEIRALLSEQLGRRHGNKVLHGHPSPLLWRERDASVESILAGRTSAARAVEKELSLYVGTPYCLPTNPDRCGFCLFPSEVYEGPSQLEEYLGYLAREGDLYAEHFAGVTPASVYFGGGTANLLPARSYGRLMGIVRRVFPRLGPGTEITLEGIPQLFNREKLAAIKDAGMNRVSMGVQQLQPEMIKLSGRKQKAEHVFRALEWCRELGLRTSIDLIFGWPTQTVETMMRDLEAVVGAGVEHLTHYELNVAGRTDFARNHQATLPSTEQNLEMFHVAARYLASHGYEQVTVYDWERRESSLSTQYLYEERARLPFRMEAGPSAGDAKLVGHDVWGWGFAGTSIFGGTPDAPGWAFINHTDVKGYFKKLDEGRFPVDRAFRYAPVDLRLSALFSMLQGMRVDLANYRAVFGLDLLEEHAPVWTVLVERGWVEIAGDTLRVVGDGVFFTPLIQTILARGRVAEIMRAGASASRAKGGAVRLAVVE
jgi:oxygen-independent coproporphyrinogen-3 oxidase